MKRNYIQPLVEQTRLITGSMIMNASPNVDNTGMQNIDPD